MAKQVTIKLDTEDYKMLMLVLKQTATRTDDCGEIVKKFILPALERQAK